MAPAEGSGVGKTWVPLLAGARRPKFCGYAANYVVGLRPSKSPARLSPNIGLYSCICNGHAISAVPARHATFRIPSFLSRYRRLSAPHRKDGKNRAEKTDQSRSRCAEGITLCSSRARFHDPRLRSAPVGCEHRRARQFCRAEVAGVERGRIKRNGSHRVPRKEESPFARQQSAPRTSGVPPFVTLRHNDSALCTL